MSLSAEARARVLFVAAVLLVAVAAAGWLAWSATRHATYEIRSQEPVSGLIRGAPVEFHGVEVGQVREVQLMGPRAVRVLLDVARDAPITSATRATITGRGLATRGFTGYVYVTLEDEGAPGKKVAVALGETYPRIATSPARSVSLDTSIQQLNDSMQSVTALLESVLDRETVGSLKRSLAQLDQVTRTLAANNAKLEALIDNAELASGQLPPLLRSGQAAVSSLHALTANTQDRLGSILAHTEQASGQFVPLLESTSEAVRSLQNQVLPEAQRTLTRLDHLSSSLDETATRIRRNPAVLLRGSASGTLGPGEGR
ncbi:MAG TPA: MlaD family protein [Ramlibacter sp.]|uniref:MlaD family protein n=1 Tax=Ramlibacter sp. TaxID=1917967 RepID=UPI002ED6BB92